MKKKNIKTQTALKCMLAFGAMQVAHAHSDAATNLNVTAGAELRLRYDGTDNLPTSSRGESGSTEYARIRIRPWMMASYEDFGFLFRLADEFRTYRVPDSMSHKQRWPDVVFIDNIYLQWESAFDMLDFKLGRQDMAFGAKRIISDGTGGDGSRSAFFDGLRVTWHADANRTMDIFGIYQASDDWLPTIGKTHANGKKTHDYDLNGYGQDEFGVGLYWQDRSCTDLGYDAYYVAKGECRSTDAKYRREGRCSNYHTFGVRLLPRFTETLRGEMEISGQVGSDAAIAGQGYAGLTWEPRVSAKSYLTGAFWILSGDEDGERGNNAWHSVFNRETGLGESIAPMYSKYNYTNLAYPHIASGCAIGDFSKVNCQLGPLFTAVKEDDAGGSYRGLYVQVKYEIHPEKLFSIDLLKGGRISFQGEYFGKGDYFRDGCDHSAVFGRAELAWKF